VNYLVKLANVGNPNDQLLMYVRGGETYSTKVPPGRYYMRVASGYTWYGKDDLFGPTTKFFRLRSRGRNSTESHSLDFVRKGNQLLGHKISFKGAFDGNMEEERISRGEF
jgi:hypothetical protein